MKFCDDVLGNICFNDSDCGEGISCLLNQTDILCTPNVFPEVKTLGFGKPLVEQPISGGSENN